jgi:Flp pilus assembly protein TadD
MPRESITIDNAVAVAERYRRAGRMEEAEALCRHVLRMRPDSYEAENLLGVLAQHGGRLGDAIVHHRRAVALAPALAFLHANLSESYRLAGRVDDAIDAARSALALHPEFAEAFNILARGLLAKGLHEEALQYCRRALALKPTLADAHENSANILKELGRLEEARRAYLEAIRFGQRTTGVYLNLSDVHRFVPDDPLLAEMKLIAERPELSVTDRLQVDFALAKAYDDLGNYPASFAHIKAGNDAKRRGIAYDEGSTLALFENIEGVFTPELIAAKTGGGNPSAAPIFVIGMPRSGTTLVEQILASHPEVYGGGELSFLPEALQSSSYPIRGPLSVPKLDREVFGELGARYIASVRRLAPSAARVTDKLPTNFYFIGLIHLALPHAKIIHVQRDAADTCLSCFSKLFAAELNYSYDLSELGRYYSHYERLMKHWRRVLSPGRILEVRYEDVVANLESQTRRMLAYCDLEWDERCLAFYKTFRPVRTASAAQVRQPIFQNSIGRWRNYAQFLKPLLSELGLPDHQELGG